MDMWPPPCPWMLRSTGWLTVLWWWELSMSLHHSMSSWTKTWWGKPTVVVNYENTGTARTLGKCQTDVLVSLLPKETQVDMTDNRATCKNSSTTWMVAKIFHSITRYRMLISWSSLDLRESLNPLLSLEKGLIMSQTVHYDRPPP